MSPQIEQLLKEAMALDETDRAFLADRLWASLDAASQSEVDAAWAAEAERRCDEVREGTAKPLKQAEVEERLRRRNDPRG
ncbi:MAG: addiction module protein [Phycisphaerae bacterium]